MFACVCAIVSALFLSNTLARTKILQDREAGVEAPPDARLPSASACPAALPSLPSRPQQMPWPLLPLPWPFRTLPPWKPASKHGLAMSLSIRLLWTLSGSSGPTLEVAPPTKRVQDETLPASKHGEMRGGPLRHKTGTATGHSRRWSCSSESPPCLSLTSSGRIHSSGCTALYCHR